MRGPIALVVQTSILACGLAACVTNGGQEAAGLAHSPIALPPAYAALPAPPPETPIEQGRRVVLDARQQEAVVVAVTRWMKRPASARFGLMTAARNSRGAITVCGDVDGHNDGGSYVGMRPYIGVLMASTVKTEFVVVGIARNGREMTEVNALCRESGVDRPG